MTLSDFLAAEQHSAVRHEFVYGKMIELPGGTIVHDNVIENLNEILKAILKPKGYKTYAQGRMVKVPDGSIFYPDVVATNEQATQELFLEAPSLIAEVMSPSSRVYDNTDKFIAYRTIPQLQYYLLVKPEAPFATLLQRTPAGVWHGQDFTNQDALVELPDLGVSFSLGDLYGV